MALKRQRSPEGGLRLSFAHERSVAVVLLKPDTCVYSCGYFRNTLSILDWKYLLHKKETTCVGLYKGAYPQYRISSRRQSYTHPNE